MMIFVDENQRPLYKTCGNLGEMKRVLAQVLMCTHTLFGDMWNTAPATGQGKF